ncbi:MAG: MFS transporter [Paracoccaceae bacterium]|nr:MFS transporter [Paracoccaceae bacterium]
MSAPIPLRAARATLASFGAMGLLWGTYAAMVPATKAMLGVDDAGFGLLFLCSSSAAVVSMLLAPRVGGLLGGAALPVGAFLMAFAFAIPGHLPSVLAFAPAMALVGFASGGLDVLMNARVSAIEAERNMHLMSLHHAMYSFAYAGGAVLTGFARGAGFGPGPVLTGAAVLAGLLALATIEPGARLRGLARDPEARAASKGPLGLVTLVGGLVILIGFFAENATEAWSALHIERTLHAAAGVGSAGPALLGLTMGIGRMSGQVLSSRLREAVLLRLAALTSATGAAIAAAAPTPAVAYLGFTILGFGVAVVAPVALALIGRITPAARRTRAIARASTLGYLGFFFGPPLLGALSNAFGLRVSFACVALMLLAMLPLLPVLTGRRAEPV